MVGGVVSGLSAAASSYYSNNGKVSLLSVGIGVITGAVSGLLTATGVGIVGQVAGGAALAAVNSAGQQLDSMYIQKTQEEFNWDNFLRDTAIGAGCSTLGGKGASYGNTKSIYNSGARLVQSIKKGKTIARAWKVYRGNARATGGKFVLLGIAKSWAINSMGSFWGIWRNK